MENKAFQVHLEKNPLISMKGISGHFTTSHAHISHYLDLSDMKSNALVARDVARELATPYLSGTLVETIVCMEKTEVVGAYLAEELVQEGNPVFNNNGFIHVVSPIHSPNGNLIFPGSTVDWISDRNIVLLVATISSGQTMKKALNCLSFYGGKTVGISTLFLASHEKQDRVVHALFSSDNDLPEYQAWEPGECDMCKAGHKLDALVSSEGYTEI